VDQAVAVAEKNPHKWMFNGASKGAAPHMWAVGGHMNQPESQQTEWRYLWGCVDGVHSVKTIHDPCPPGWKVPTNEVWMELFAQPELSAGGRGAYCPDYDIYIPFGGQKKAGDSNITGVTNSIYLASATVTGINIHPIGAYFVICANTADKNKILLSDWTVERIPLKGEMLP
jgi:hypothetical protein